MTKKTIRVLVVDDSAVLREQICDVLAGAEGLEVAGVARDGEEAVRKVAELSPDVVTLDVLMPRMDGLAALDAILAVKPVPVVMVSALTQRAADVTLQALDRGAMDYVAKPENLQQAGGAFRDELVHKVRVMAGADVRRVLQIRKARAQGVGKPARTPLAQRAASTVQYENCCVAIGISTGGPPALSRLFQAFEPPLPPIVIVQHMPANFTGPFAARLDSISAMSVKEAAPGDVLRPNHALVAPGGRHLRLHRRGGSVVVDIEDGEPVSSHKPSVDVMMYDAAKAFGPRCLGVIMTGMGHDGADGCRAIRAAGGYVLGQDEVSSDVYGMNKVAFVDGHVDRQFALPDLPELLARQCNKMFRQSTKVASSTSEARATAGSY
ncbi:MAG: chemotaxis response regulator protein-glutamate methylesterase [Planctomycetales bacterium]|nr:chemotaxis response regulator protein-glutamate methylesterase [Planctomycetales bacterium]